MLNLIRMELYRMFKTKSLYVLWIVMLGAVLLTTSLVVPEVENARLMEENYQYSQEIQSSVSTNIGMSVVLPTAPQDKVTLYDIVFANMQGHFFAIFVVIFAVIFTTADLKTGYIKNIAGQLRKREQLIGAKVVAMLVYTVLTEIVFVLGQAVANRLLFGYLRLGEVKVFMTYLGMQTLLHFALALICMALAILIRNNVSSMIAVICMCMNVLVIVYSGLDEWLHKAGLENFHTIQYTVTGRIAMLSMDVTGKEMIQTGEIAAAFIIVAVLLSGFVFKKRDI